MNGYLMIMLPRICSRIEFSAKKVKFCPGKNRFSTLTKPI